MSVTGDSWKRLIDEHGTSVVLTKRSSSGYNPSSGVSSVKEEVYNTFGYFYNKTAQPLGEETTARNMRFCVISGLDLSVTPDIGDMIEGESDSTVIEFVRKVTSGKNLLVYILGLKQ